MSKALWYLVLPLGLAQGPYDSQWVRENWSKFSKEGYLFNSCGFPIFTHDFEGFEMLSNVDYGVASDAKQLLQTEQDIFSDGIEFDIQSTPVNKINVFKKFVLKFLYFFRLIFLFCLLSYQSYANAQQNPIDIYFKAAQARLQEDSRSLANAFVDLDKYRNSFEKDVIPSQDFIAAFMFYSLPLETVKNQKKLWNFWQSIPKSQKNGIALMGMNAAKIENIFKNEFHKKSHSEKVFFDVHKTLCDMFSEFNLIPEKYKYLKLSIAAYGFWYALQMSFIVSDLQIKTAYAKNILHWQSFINFFNPYEKDILNFILQERLRVLKGDFVTLDEAAKLRADFIKKLQVTTNFLCSPLSSSIVPDFIFQSLQIFESFPKYFPDIKNYYDSCFFSDYRRENNADSEIYLDDSSLKNQSVFLYVPLKKSRLSEFLKKKFKSSSNIYWALWGELTHAFDTDFSIASTNKLFRDNCLSKRWPEKLCLQLRWHLADKAVVRVKMLPQIEESFSPQQAARLAHSILLDMSLNQGQFSAAIVPLSASDTETRAQLNEMLPKQDQTVPLLEWYLNNKNSFKGD